MRKKIQRFGALALSACLALACLTGCQAEAIDSDELLAPEWVEANHEFDVKVGAIRWDAWIGEESPAQGETVEVSLSPEKYHYRLPWYAEILDKPVTSGVHEDARDDEYFRNNSSLTSQFPPNNPLSPMAKKSVLASATTQQAIDKEIRFAKAAGIDYWAILWYDYGQDSKMRLQRDLYLSSMQRNAMDWCHILGGGFAVAASSGDAQTNEYIQSVVASMKLGNYLKTNDGRPVVQVFEPETWMENTYAKFITEAKRQGLDPYMVGLVFDTGVNTSMPRLNAIQAEAVSAYCTGGNGGISYAENRSAEAYNWESYASFGLDVIPPVTSGWDKRPRHDYANPWEYGAAEVFANQWVQQGTPEEIAAHLSDGMNFVEENGFGNEFNSVLVYAWNENDEGGWINPTLFEMRDEKRPLRLDAIRDQIIGHRVNYRDVSNSNYRASIEALAASYVFENVNGSKFESGRSVSVAEFVSWTMRAFGLMKDGVELPESKGNNFYADDVALAKAFGLLDGIPDADIRLTKRISPEQAESLLAGCVKLLGMAKDDAAGSAFVKTAVTDALYDGKITRGAAAQMILNVLEMPYKDYSWERTK